MKYYISTTQYWFNGREFDTLAEAFKMAKKLKHHNPQTQYDIHQRVSGGRVRVVWQSDRLMGQKSIRCFFKPTPAYVEQLEIKDLFNTDDWLGHSMEPREAYSWAREEVRAYPKST